MRACMCTCESRGRCTVGCCWLVGWVGVHGHGHVQQQRRRAASRPFIAPQQSRWRYPLRPGTVCVTHTCTEAIILLQYLQELWIHPAGLLVPRSLSFAVCGVAACGREWHVGHVCAPAAPAPCMGNGRIHARLQPALCSLEEHRPLTTYARW